jgi:hypothetical protein
MTISSIFKAKQQPLGHGISRRVARPPHEYPAGNASTANASLTSEYTREELLSTVSYDSGRDATGAVRGWRGATWEQAAGAWFLPGESVIASAERGPLVYDFMPEQGVRDCDKGERP